jgi:uncharacterized protein (DUF3820 family)
MKNIHGLSGIRTPVPLGQKSGALTTELPGHLMLSYAQKSVFSWEIVLV